MLTKKTVFVIGAGASANYGFPLGSGLIERLQQIEDVATRFGYLDEETKKRLLEFRGRLSNAIPPSIDVFLEDNPDLLEIGKRCIARALMECEQHDKVASANADDHWLKALWHDIRQPPASFGSQPISFITYNYDRSLEHFLVHTLAHSYPKVSLAEAWQSVSRFKIFHAHGQLGPYTPGIDRSEPMASRVFVLGGEPAWDEQERAAQQELQRKAERKKLVPEGYRRFGSIDVGDFEAESLAAGGISLFWEKTASQKQTRKGMQKVLSEAERIVFLGFGFLEANLDHLEEMWPHDRISMRMCEVFGTSFRLAAKRRARVLKLFPDQRRLLDTTCSELIREHVLLD